MRVCVCAVCMSVCRGRVRVCVWVGGFRWLPHVDGEDGLGAGAAWVFSPSPHLPVVTSLDNNNAFGWVLSLSLLCGVCDARLSYAVGSAPVAKTTTCKAFPEEA